MIKDCWYKDDCVVGMNKFYDEHIKNYDLYDFFKPFTALLDEVKIDKEIKRLIDIGCGTAMITKYIKGYDYTGADLEKIIEGCAKRNFPEYKYVYVDIFDSDCSFLQDYDLVLANGLIVIIQDPLANLEKLLKNSNNYLLIHRQEILQNGKTETVIGQGYGEEAVGFHSKIARKDFEEIIEKYKFEIVKEVNLALSNWENGGHSFLLKKKKKGVR
jgi:SAM-dependent methyltransferase